MEAMWTTMLCGFSMQQYTNLLHPWRVAVWVCNNAQCTMQQFRRQLFLIRFIPENRKNKAVYVLNNMYIVSNYTEFHSLLIVYILEIWKNGEVSILYFILYIFDAINILTATNSKDNQMHEFQNEEWNLYCVWQLERLRSSSNFQMEWKSIWIIPKPSFQLCFLPT